MVSNESAYAQAPWLAADFRAIAVEHSSGVLTGVSGLGTHGFEDVVQRHDVIRFYATRCIGHGPVCMAGGSSAENFALLVGEGSPSLH